MMFTYLELYVLLVYSAASRLNLIKDRFISLYTDLVIFLNFSQFFSWAYMVLVESVTFSPFCYLCDRW